jgi:hypothetical protein
MGSGETKKEMLYEVRQKLYATKQETSWRESLKKRKQRYAAEQKSNNPTLTKEELEIMINAQEDIWIEEHNTQEKPFDEAWFPDYWLVFCYMGKPSGNTSTSFNTTPITEKSEVEVGNMIKANAAKQSRATRRAASVAAAFLNNNAAADLRPTTGSSNNVVPNKHSNASSNNDIYHRFSMQSDPVELKLRAAEIRIEEKKIKHNLINSKLDEISRLEDAIKRMSERDPIKFKDTIEKLQVKIDSIYISLPTYVHVDDDEDDLIESNLTIDNLAFLNSTEQKTKEDLVTPENVARDLNQNNSSSSMQKPTSVNEAEPIRSRITTRGKNNPVAIQSDDEGAVEYEESSQESEYACSNNQEDSNDEDKVLAFVSKTKQTSKKTQMRNKSIVPEQLKPLSERFPAMNKKGNNNKKTLPQRPMINLPQWDSCETANSKLHGIFGFEGKYDQTIISQEAKNVLVNKLHDNYGVVIDNVLPFFDELLEKIKIDMEKDEDEKCIWERWVRCIDNVTNQL